MSNNLPKELARAQSERLELVDQLRTVTDREWGPLGTPENNRLRAHHADLTNRVARYDTLIAELKGELGR